MVMDSLDVLGVYCWLYVSDYNLHCVQYFSATTGQYIGQFGSNGNGNGQFSRPHGMSTDGKGNILRKMVHLYKSYNVMVLHLM